MAQERNLPVRMTSPGTGEWLTRGVRPFPVQYKGEPAVVNLPGFYPAGEGDGVHVGDDMAIVDVTLRGLKAKADSTSST